MQIDIRIVWSDIEAVKGAGASAEDETVGWLMGTHGRQTRAVPGAVIGPASLPALSAHPTNSAAA